MIFDTIFPLLSDAPGVTNIIGSSPVRIYEGAAPQDVTRPYAVFQIVGGAPENYQDGVPGMDSFRFQIDAYANGRTEARELALAIRDAIEPHHHMLSSPMGPIFEPDTKLFRYILDFQAWINRPEPVGSP